MLLGRARERQEIGHALAQARSGTSATLALAGEPGIGKTALLDYAAGQATGMRLLRARGIESEAQIPFASLLELIRPALPMLGKIPGPQAAAMESALALRPGSGHERFAVGAATLSLLAAYAEDAPVAVVIDDAHWLDGSSAQALLFAFRRLVADPIAVLIAVRDGEPSLLDGADLPTLRLGGLTSDEAAMLVLGLAPEAAARLYGATAGNPLALLELAPDAHDLALAPEGAPVLVPATIAGAFLRRAGTLSDTTRQALVLAATSDSSDLTTLGRAAAHLGVDLSALAGAEAAGLVTLDSGRVEFRHPLARSAIYADAPAGQRRDAHRALAGALPDRDVDRRAWHLAAAATGPDEAASAALEQAGARSRDRSAYATAAAAYERAGRLAADHGRRGRLLREAAEAGWLAGLADRAVALLDEARAVTSDPVMLVEIAALAGHIATRRGPVMRGHAILTAAAERADPERAVSMLAEAASACFYAGNPAEMLAAAERARAALPGSASVRTRFMAAMAAGMARILGGDAAAGAESVHQATELAESSAELREDLRLIPWLAVGPLFLREAGTERSLLEPVLRTARAHTAVGALPFILNLIARDQATTDRWAIAEATYSEAINLARESGQQTELTFGLAGLAWLQARRGTGAGVPPLRRRGPPALGGTRDAAVLKSGPRRPWENSNSASVRPPRPRGTSSSWSGCWPSWASPMSTSRPRRTSSRPTCGSADHEAARRAAARFVAAADAKGQPWSLARALRCQGLLAGGDSGFTAAFEQALALHALTPDSFEAARTRLAYGERLRRARNRVRAREQLRAAAEVFERLDAQPWADRARAELAATGETRRARDPSTLDELTPQELQIAVLLTGGKTTREAAAALFLSPKTVEYHLRHVYQKLGIHSREELARVLAAQGPRATGGSQPPTDPSRDEHQPADGSRAPRRPGALSSAAP